jgi:DNA-binding ferritin-like protein
MEKELLANIIQMQGQLKVLHWQTESYAEHKAFEKTLNALMGRFDRIIEVYSGKYQRPKFGGVKQITFADYDNLKIEAFIEAFEDFMNNSFMAQQDAELNNIKDEIVADIQKLKYLLTLK